MWVVTLGNSIAIGQMSVEQLRLENLLFDDQWSIISIFCMSLLKDFEIADFKMKQKIDEKKYGKFQFFFFSKILALKINKRSLGMHFFLLSFFYVSIIFNTY